MQGEWRSVDSIKIIEEYWKNDMVPDACIDYYATITWGIKRVETRSMVISEDVWIYVSYEDGYLILG